LSDSSSSRRRFLQQTAALGLLHTSRHSFAKSLVQMNDMHQTHTVPDAPGKTVPMLHVLQLPPFVDPLPLPETMGVAHPGKLRITMREIHAKVHRDVPSTLMWSYGPTPLAPIIEARSGHPLEIEWVNSLPTKHFLPIDYSLHGCGHDVPDVRTSTHVHGARVPSKADGYPTDWFVPGKSKTCLYPLQQDASTLWYHDHAMGLNRLNTYAGLFGLFLVRDSAEDSLQLPSGKHEIPLILYDRELTADGQFFYPTSGDPEHPWVSEFEGDGILINGKIRPYFEVEPRLYRFRILNTANSRFFNLSLDTQEPITLIGSDQGLLAAPADIPHLILAPAERGDVLIDFTKSSGKTVHLRNGALDILQFRVAAQTASPTPSAPSIPKTLRTITRIPESSAITTRTITLDEYKDKVGNSMLMVLNQKRWHEPVTEKPRLNTTEIWEFVNLTEDTHPLHLHLVRFQLLDRRRFDVFSYYTYNKLRYTSDPVPPAPGEAGWKDTIQCSPKAITRIIVKFEGYTGNYLYHCHVLEHEANDMMRPFEVIA
jgi:spore coat protein A, manganese oxidase